MSELHRITVDPNQCGGQPCIRGLRIRIKDILDLLASGAGREEILKGYPYLESEDITAALEYAACQNDHAALLDQASFTVEAETFREFQKLLDNPLPPTDALRRLLTTKGPWE